MSNVFFRTNDAGSGNVFFRTNDTGTTTPAIVSVNNTAPPRGSTLVLSVTNAGASAGTVTIGGVAQTVLSWNDNTTVSVAVVRGSNKYGVPLDLVLTRADAAVTSPFALFSIQPAAGWQSVNIASLATPSSNRLTAVAELAIGDQVSWGNILASGAAAVLSDATWQADGGVAKFDAEAWTADGGWGAIGTQLTTPVVPLAILSPLLYQPNAPSALMPDTAGLVFQLRTAKTSTTQLYAGTDGSIVGSRFAATVPPSVGSVGAAVWLDAYWTQTIAGVALRLNVSGAVTLQAGT